MYIINLTKKKKKKTQAETFSTRFNKTDLFKLSVKLRPSLPYSFHDLVQTKLLKNISFTEIKAKCWGI